MMQDDVYMAAWLFPCVLSFITSLLVIGNISFTKKLRSQFFQQLSFILALSDIVQTCPTFLGNYGRYRSASQQSYAICRFQSYTFQFGVLTKTLILVVIGATAWHVVMQISVPMNKILIFSSIVLIPLVMISISISFQTGDIFCLEHFDYTSASQSERRSALVFVAIFLLPLYILVALLILFIIKIRTRMSQWIIRNSIVEVLLNRMQLYPIAYVACLIPGSSAVISTFFFNKSFLFLDIATGFFVSITGFIIGVIYFSRQTKFPPFVESLLATYGCCGPSGLYTPLEVRRVADDYEDDDSDAALTHDLSWMLSADYSTGTGFFSNSSHDTAAVVRNIITQDSCCDTRATSKSSSSSGALRRVAESKPALIRSEQSGDNDSNY